MQPCLAASAFFLTFTFVTTTAVVRRGTATFADVRTVSTTPPIASAPPIAVSTPGTCPRHSHAIADATSGCTYRKLETFDAVARDNAKFQHR